jgi:DnaK suppressor protein
MSSHIKPKEMEELRELLLEEKRKILDHLVKLQGDSTSELSQLSGDQADVASIEISQNSMTKLGSRQRRLLKKIDLALDKMDDGSYGICELTGEPIPVARLKARPVAQYTVEAKEELERRERGYRDRSDDDDVFGADDDGDE